MVPTSSAGILNLNFADLISLPSKITPERPMRKGRMKQYAMILTSTPVKDSLVENLNKKAAKAVEGKNIVRKTKHKP